MLIEIKFDTTTKKLIASKDGTPFDCDEINIYRDYDYPENHRLTIYKSEEDELNKTRTQTVLIASEANPLHDEIRKRLKF